ncbi:MAG: TrkH family potassium uptake protein [Armatimonadota bacterium]
MTDRRRRSHLHLRKRYRAIISYTGMILLICAGLMVAPLACALVWPSELRLAPGFMGPALGLGAVGVTLWRVFRLREPTALTTQQGSVIVVLSWMIACIASAFPFMIVEGLGFTHGLFEAVSGWTTTGLSVIDVTQASHMTLIWRSLMQLAGGAGLAIIMVASIAGPTGTGLAMAEGRSEQLVPHVRASVKLVLTLYIGYALVGVLAYWIAGMGLFDAINHSFAAVATGGFSTRPESIGMWDEMRVEAVTIPLMLLGSLNFLTAWGLLRRRFQRATRSGELRLVAVVIPVAALLLFALVTGGLYAGEKAGRVAVFESVSALTGTGFATVSYEEWSGFGLLIIVTLMCIGGGVGSTSGGIKQYRVYVLLKSLFWKIRRAFLPPTTVFERWIWQGDYRDFIDERRLRGIADYFFLYVGSLLVATLVIAAAGFGLEESLFEAASMLGTVGLSVGVTSANAPSAVLWTGIIAMFLGRLEFYVVVIGLVKLAVDVWKIAVPRRSPPTGPTGNDRDPTTDDSEQALSDE